MDQKPLITAVITTFQRPRLLRRAIESVQKQTVSNLSIIIYDSDSQDETEEMANEIVKQDDRVSYYRHPQIISPVHNYQFGIQQVKTPFFSLLSDDDFLFPFFYEKALYLLDKYPTAEFFLGSTIDAFLNANPISAGARNWPDKEFYLPKEGLLYTIRSYFNWTGAVYRTQTVQDHPINPDVVPGDYDFILRLAAQYPFTFSSFPCAVFTHHSGSFSNSCGLKLIYPSLFKMADAIYKMRPKEELAELKTAFNDSFLRKSLQIGIQSLIHNDFVELELISKVIQAEYSTQFLGRWLPRFFKFLRCHSLFLSFFLAAFSYYRWVKSFKIKNYLKNHSIDLSVYNLNKSEKASNPFSMR